MGLRDKLRNLIFILLFSVTTFCFAESQIQLTAVGDLEGMLPIGVSSANLVGYWKLNNSAVDSSGNGVNGTIVGATGTADKFSRTNKAMFYDGADNVITIPDDAIDISGDFSVSFWIKPEDDGNNPRWVTILSNGDNFQTGHMGNDEDVFFRYDSTVIRTDDPIDLSVWSHVVITMDSGTRKIYINDVDRATSAGGITADGLFSAIGGGYGSYNINGTLDEVMIFERVLTSAEITALYGWKKAEFDEMNFTTTSLIGYYQLNGNANDSSGQGNNGVITNVTATTDRFSVADRAMDFDGASGYIEIADSQALRMTAGGTITAWVYPESIGEAAGRIIDKSTGSSGTNGYALFIYTGNKFHLSIDGSTTYLISNAITYNNWYFVATTFDGSGRIIYVNGVDDTFSGGAETALPPDVADVVTIGNWSDGSTRTFDGKIDEVKIFTRTLTPTEITNMYNHEKGKFGIYDNNKVTSPRFIEDSGLAVEMRHKQTLTVKGEISEI